jgi:hypothetical protein
MLTKLSKTVLLVFLALSFMACSFLTSAFQPTPIAEDVAREEQAVYAFFLSKGPVLILQNTAVGTFDDDPKAARDFIRSGLENASSETLSSFIERNAQSSQLAPDMQIGVEYTLLSEKELSTFTKQPNWGDLLAEKYPGTHGYTVFSRVGFNKSLTQAVVYVGNVGGPMMGSGSYFLLEKQNGEWLLMDEVMAWIS